MKKIAILTFHWTKNYGGLLQAYALQKSVEQLGYDVEIINYFNKRDLSKQYSSFKKIIHAIWSVFSCFLFGGFVREKKTKIFRMKYLNISKEKYISYEDLLNRDNDIYSYIVGSDQVWKPELTGNPSVYLLSFVNNKSKRISYAASFGSSSLDEKYKKLYTNELKKFNNISLRENSSKKIIEELIGDTPSVVMDPVFLLSCKQWMDISSPKKNKYDYILCYFMPTANQKIIKCIKRLAKYYSKKIGCKIINIGKKEYEIIKFWENNNNNAGPADFVSLIKNAKMVITNSFHGTAFSIKMNIPFIVPVDYTIDIKKRLSIRIESLLEDINCLDRLIKINENYSKDSLDLLIDMDFIEINKKIDFLTQQSLDYLKNALS